MLSCPDHGSHPLNHTGEETVLTTVNAQNWSGNFTFGGTNALTFSTVWKGP